jgi:hypothetical protein
MREAKPWCKRVGQQPRPAHLGAGGTQAFVARMSLNRERAMSEYVDREPNIQDGRTRPIDNSDHRHGLFSGLHRFLGGFPTAFFSFALVTDFVYMQSAELQWQYFSIWLITAALIMGGLAVVAGIVDWATGGARGRGGFGWHCWSACSTRSSTAATAGSRWCRRVSSCRC